MTKNDWVQNDQFPCSCTPCNHNVGSEGMWETQCIFIGFWGILYIILHGNLRYHYSPSPSFVNMLEIWYQTSESVGPLLVPQESPVIPVLGCCGLVILAFSGVGWADCLKKVGHFSLVVSALLFFADFYKKLWDIIFKIENSSITLPWHMNHGLKYQYQNAYYCYR